MELWIRSQDKTDLVKANALWIMDNQIWMEVPFYENHKKLGLTVAGHNHKLAEYATKERALLVLDEIQNLIRGKFALDLDKKTVMNSKDANEMAKWLMEMAVYEMPKE